MVSAVTEERLDGLPDLAAAEATCTDADTPGRSINHRADTLKIGIEGALRLIVGVTDVMA